MARKLWQEPKVSIFQTIAGSGSKVAFLSLRKFDPLYYSSKAYRDGVIGSNILRKATQLVAQIEAARNVSTNPIADLLKHRGGTFDTKS